MTQKKKKTSYPTHKTLKKEQRLQKAPAWIAKYDGKNIVRGYRKHFAVSLLCAAKELKMLGYDIDENYINQLKLVEERRKIMNMKRKEERNKVDMGEDSDETFYYIAGYTSGGAPYGITWEEIEEENEIYDVNISTEIYEDEMPF